MKCSVVELVHMAYDGVSSERSLRRSCGFVSFFSFFSFFFPLCFSFHPSFRPRQSWRPSRVVHSSPLNRHFASLTTSVRKTLKKAPSDGINDATVLNAIESANAHRRQWRDRLSPSADAVLL